MACIYIATIALCKLLGNFVLFSIAMPHGDMCLFISVTVVESFNTNSIYKFAGPHRTHLATKYFTTLGFRKKIFSGKHHFGRIFCVIQII
jgi:hypothetical protein